MHRKTHFVFLTLFSLVFLLCTACDHGEKKKDDNTNNINTCDDLDCGAHGVCIEDGTGPYCRCDEGYQGPTCNTCANGYEPQGDLCVLPEDLYFGTPVIDGSITVGENDWRENQKVGTNTTASDWGANTLQELYMAYDQTHLYIGVVGTVEMQNAIAVYLDLDYGPTSRGIDSIASTTDNDGALDNAMSSAITIEHAEFRADWAVGTKGMASVTSDLSDNAGWRDIATNPADFHWKSGIVIAGTNSVEAAIPFNELFGSLPVNGTRIAVFARLVNEDGQYMANQSLPEDNPQMPSIVNRVAVITLRSNQTNPCDNDGTCDTGENFNNCPNDCPLTGECGDPNAFTWEDAVMYFVLVDRFFDSDGQHQEVPGVDWAAQFQGGDWNGVTTKLSYLTDLGINTLWLSAPYKNRDLPGAAIDPGSDNHMYSAYHGYWPSPANIDYSDLLHPQPTPAVESRLGTSDDLQTLVDSAHAENMFVLFDYVMNHVDSQSGLYAAHNDWFYQENGNPVLCSPNYWNDPYYSTRCAFTNYLPPFDFYQSWVRQWSVADAIWWALTYGIDGYRLDAIKHVPMEWLTDLRAALNTYISQPAGGRFYLVGETYDYDNRQVLKNFIDPTTKLDGQFDFPLRKRICDAVFKRSMSLDDLFTFWNENDTFYGSNTLMSTWIGNHDIPRAIHFASGQIDDCYQGSGVGNSWNPGAFQQPSDAAPYERLALAFGLLLTNRGVPLIYYGDEIGMAGGGDPDNRRMMMWEGLNTHQTQLRETVRRLLQIRRENISLRRGRRVTVTGGIDTFAYKLTGCGNTEDVYVFVNRSDTDTSIAGLPSGNWMELVTNTPTSGGNPVSVPARSLRIFKVQ